MNYSTQDAREERHMPYVVDGIRLDIVVTKMGNDEWSLAVFNERGIFSTWCEYFQSPDIAIRTAIKAMREEGIEEFTSIEGFEYLEENHEDVWRDKY
ncbi:MAG: hypothetical protein U5S82_21825 [Gammaproteobacteria bacterium]|nr:hypothetical protein [Gammaproteobacteria bacterium]